jgi:hypothetical protein
MVDASFIVGASARRSVGTLVVHVAVCDDRTDLGDELRWRHHVSGG